MKTEIFTYPLGDYNFPKIIAELMEVNNLADMGYQENQTASDEFSLYKNMEQTPVYKRLYRKLNGEEGREFFHLFEKFIKELIRPQYDEPIYYQKKPTHRILFKGVPGVARFHRDRQYGHNPNEINYFLPVTRAFQTNTLWIESEEGKDDLTPLEMEPGNVARFDGANLLHGAQVNETGKTRVSFDFRVIPASLKEGQDKKNLERELDKNAHFFELCK